MVRSRRSPIGHRDRVGPAVVRLVVAARALLRGSAAKGLPAVSFLSRQLEAIHHRLQVVQRLPLLGDGGVLAEARDACPVRLSWQPTQRDPRRARPGSRAPASGWPCRNVDGLEAHRQVRGCSPASSRLVDGRLAERRRASCMVRPNIVTPRAASLEKPSMMRTATASTRPGGASSRCELAAREALLEAGLPDVDRPGAPEG